MTFSVIIPFFNEERYIERCIKALLDQNFDKREYEIIFVDNGSTDKSCEIVKQFSKVGLLYNYVNYDYACRNRGLEIARGDIIACTDADSTVSMDWLSRIYEGMERTGAAIAIGRCCFPEESSALLRLFEDYENTKVEYILNNCARKYFLGCGRNMAIKATCFKRFGNFVESPILGDTEFVQRCVSRDPGTKVVYLKGMKITHLEVTDLESWFKKIKSYGEHSRHENMPDYRPISYGKKMEIYMHTIRTSRYGLRKSLIFIALLMLGDICYKLGRFKGFLNSK